MPTASQGREELGKRRFFVFCFVSLFLGGWLGIGCFYFNFYKNQRICESLKNVCTQICETQEQITDKLLDKFSQSLQETDPLYLNIIQ